MKNLSINELLLGKIRAAYLPASAVQLKINFGAKRSLPTAGFVLPDLRRNQERAVRRVCGVLDSQILPVRRVMPDREAVGHDGPPVGWGAAQPGRRLNHLVGFVRIVVGTGAEVHGPAMTVRSARSARYP
jgi:hypothetical protein